MHLCLGRIRYALVTAGTAFLPNLIGRLMQFAALEEKYDTPLDFNTELVKWGAAGMIASPGLMTPCVSFSVTMVAFEAGAVGKLPSVMVVISSLAFLAYGVQIVTIVPKTMLAGALRGPNRLRQHVCHSHVVPVAVQ